MNKCTFLYYNSNRQRILDCHVKNTPCRLTVRFLIHVLQFFHSFNDKGRVRTMSSIEAVCDNTTKFNDYNQNKQPNLMGIIKKHSQI